MSILLVLHTKIFCHFYISQFLTFESFNLTKKQVIEVLYQHFLIGKLKNILYNLKNTHIFYSIIFLQWYNTYV